MKTLVFAAHPDDEIIGCGGYLAKLIKNKNPVEVAYLTIPSAERKNEIERVKKYMNFEEIYFLGGKERSRKPQNARLLGNILKAIRSSRPNQLIVPHKGERDGDHKFLSETILECVHLANSNFLLGAGDEPFTVRTVLGYEIWSPLSDPQLTIDITGFMETKRNAMRLYGSQLKHKNYLSLFEGLNKYRASSSGHDGYLEAFEVYKLDEEF